MGKISDNQEKLQKMFQDLSPDLHVYYQPPPDFKMEYPAIVYSLNQIDNRSANNNVYKQDYRYQVMIIDPNPDSEFIEPVSMLSKCTFANHYIVNNLYHDVFYLYL